jgi:P27 family predicted phage terminase small subunit
VAVNPLLHVATKALNNCNRLWPELGLTPSSRSRVSVIDPGTEHDAFAEFDTPLPPTPSKRVQ